MHRVAFCEKVVEHTIKENENVEKKIQELDQFLPTYQEKQALRSYAEKWKKEVVG